MTWTESYPQKLLVKLGFVCARAGRIVAQMYHGTASFKLFGHWIGPCTHWRLRCNLHCPAPLVKGLNVSLTRYPGGNFVSNYNWKDGVGPKDERPPRMELAWARLETNQFGTNEFMDYAKRMNTEPYFAVNLGTGTIKEAQEWVEYCNVKEGPYYAELRKKHGYPEPHNIKYWSLGNEMDGFWQMGHLNAEDYSKKAREAGKLMKLTDPDIKLIAAGASNFRPNNDPHEWNATVLSELRDVVDYIALHMYLGNHQDNYYNFGMITQWIEPGSIYFLKILPFARIKQRYRVLKKYGLRVSMMAELIDKIGRTKSAVKVTKKIECVAVLTVHYKALEMQLSAGNMLITNSWLKLVSPEANAVLAYSTINPPI